MKRQPRKPNLLIHVVSVLKDALFPARCLVCGAFIHHSFYRNCEFPVEGLQVETLFGFNKLTAPFLCKLCSEGFGAVESPKCSKCGVMFKSREGEDHICGACLMFPKKFGMARSAGAYGRALMAVIHCLKYNGKVQLARPLGRLLFAAYVRFWEKEEIDMIVPVPLHIRRMRKRGFNQAFLLIREWTSLAEKLNLKQPGIRIDRNALIREKWAKPQTGLSRKKRLKNIKDAFRVRNSANVVGKRILIVDDVYTTGATANECAKVLLAGGAARVDVLTLAQAL